MFTIFLAVVMFFALILQLLGVVPNFGGQVLLMPVVFLYAAAALPLWGMLLLAFLAGFMWDCLIAVPVDGRMEFFFGWNILVFGALGAVMNGLHPLFIRGRWQVHCLLTGVLISLLVLLEFALITFRREPFALLWSADVWKRILGSGLSAFIVSPVLFFSLNWIGRRLGHFDRARAIITTTTP